MSSLKKEDIKQEVFDLYDDYAHNKIDRRQFAGLDKRVNAGWEDYEKVLKANNAEHTAHFYPDVNHGFHNNTTPRYDEAVATLAWTRTIEFFKEKLK